MDQQEDKSYLRESCSRRWPASRFKAFRYHVDLAERGEGQLRRHLEDCLPGPHRELQRKQALDQAFAILRIYGNHPDVIAGRRKASQIWLAAHGLANLEPIAGSWEDKTKARLVELFEAQVKKANEGER